MRAASAKSNLALPPSKEITTDARSSKYSSSSAATSIFQLSAKSLEMNVVKESRPNWFKEHGDAGLRFSSFHVENRKEELSVQIQMEEEKREFEQNSGSSVTPNFSHTSPSFVPNELSRLHKSRMFCFPDLER